MVTPGAGCPTPPPPPSASPRLSDATAKDKSASVLKKKVFKIFFRRSQKKKQKGLHTKIHKNFSGDLQKNTYSKKFFRHSINFKNFMFSSRGQANF